MREGVIVRITGSKNRGVFALRCFRSGEMIFATKRKAYVKEQTPYTYQVGDNSHIEVETEGDEDPVILMNHSCEPNTHVRDNKFGAYDFIAMKDINPGEEIVWDYAMTDYESVGMMGRKCECGAKGCRKFITGWRGLPLETKRLYMKNRFMANYLNAFCDDFQKG